MMRSTHAEMYALREDLKTRFIYNFRHIVYDKRKKGKVKQLKFATLYVLRNSPRKTNDVIGHVCGIAKPCENCEKYLKLHGVGTVKFTQYNEELGINMLCTMKLVDK